MNSDHVKENFNSDDFNYSEDHLRILSGLYGLLRPLDLIQPYRLEMGTKMKNTKGKNLYDFWGTKISEQLNSDIENHESTYIVTIYLASLEFICKMRKKIIFFVEKIPNLCLSKEDILLYFFAKSSSLCSGSNFSAILVIDTKVDIY